jgi:hypothetical protein
MSRRNIAVVRRVQTSIGEGGGPAPFVGVIDDMIAAGGVAPKFFPCISHRLYSAYTGDAILLRRAGDNATTGVPYTGAGLLDEAAIAAFCTTNDGFVQTAYDNSGNGNDVTQAALSQQPKIYDGATTSVLKRGTLPWMTFSRAANQYLSRGDALGITGASALTLAYVGEYTGGAFRQTMLAIGDPATTAAALLALYDGGSTTKLANFNGNGASSFRRFTPGTTIAVPGAYVHQLAAATSVSASTLRQNGAALTASESVGAPGATLTDTAFFWGANGTSANPVGGGAACAFADNSVVSGGSLAKLEDFFAARVAQT